MAYTTMDKSTAPEVSSRKRALVSVFVASCFAVGVIVGLAFPDVLGLEGSGRATRGIRGASSREDAEDSVPVRKTYGHGMERNLKDEAQWEAITSKDRKADMREFYGAWGPGGRAQDVEDEEAEGEMEDMMVPAQLRAARGSLFEVDESVTGLADFGTSFSYDFDTFALTELEEIHTPSKLETLRNVLLQNKLKAERDVEGIQAWAGAVGAPDWKPAAFTKWDMEFDEEESSFSYDFAS